MFEDLGAAAMDEGRNSWALQEKLKGRMWWFDVSGSRYGGWGFNLSDGYSFMGQHISPSIANTYAAELLREAPFFTKDPTKGQLYVQDGGTTSEDECNEMLASQVPAATVAAGGPGGGKMDEALLEDNVINMQDTFTNGWPQERGKDNAWRHSDLRNFSYLYTYKVFEELMKPTGATP